MRCRAETKCGLSLKLAKACQVVVGGKRWRLFATNGLAIHLPLSSCSATCSLALCCCSSTRRRLPAQLDHSYVLILLTSAKTSREIRMDEGAPIQTEDQTPIPWFRGSKDVEPFTLCNVIAVRQKSNQLTTTKADISC